jgi:hypothetical protein
MGLTVAPNLLGQQQPAQSQSFVPAVGVDLATGASQADILAALQTAIALLTQIAANTAGGAGGGVPTNALIDDLGGGLPLIDDLDGGLIFINDLA